MTATFAMPTPGEYNQEARARSSRCPLDQSSKSTLLSLGKTASLAAGLLYVANARRTELKNKIIEFVLSAGKQGTPLPFTHSARAKLCRAFHADQAQLAHSALIATLSAGTDILEKSIPTSSHSDSLTNVLADTSLLLHAGTTAVILGKVFKKLFLPARESSKLLEMLRKNISVSRGTIASYTPIGNGGVITYHPDDYEIITKNADSSEKTPQLSEGTDLLSCDLFHNGRKQFSFQLPRSLRNSSRCESITQDDIMYESLSMTSYALSVAQSFFFITLCAVFAAIKAPPLTQGILIAVWDGTRIAFDVVKIIPSTLSLSGNLIAASVKSILTLVIFDYLSQRAWRNIDPRDLRTLREMLLEYQEALKREDFLPHAETATSTETNSPEAAPRSSVVIENSIAAFIDVIWLEKPLMTMLTAYGIASLLTATISAGLLHKIPHLRSH